MYTNKERLYSKNLGEMAFRLIVPIVSEGIERVKHNQTFVRIDIAAATGNNGGDFIIYYGNAMNRQILYMNYHNSMCLMDYPIDSVVKGLDQDGRRRVHKSHTEKFSPIDSSINNILLQYDIQTDKTTCMKLIVFSIKLLQHDATNELSFYDFSKGVLNGNNNISTLLSQHLWDYTIQERIDTLEEINVELHQDLLQYLFNARIFYYTFDQRENDYKFKEPRFNGWYSINTTYERVMFIFKARNENLYTCFFNIDTNDNGTVGYNTYSLPLNDKIRNSYHEAHAVAPLTINLNNPSICGQLIDSYGKSVGLKLGNDIVRYEARAPVMFPLPVNRLDKKKLFVATYPITINSERFSELHSNLIGNTNNKGLLDREDHTRQTRQHFSVMFKSILKYLIVDQRNHNHRQKHLY